MTRARRIGHAAAGFALLLVALLVRADIAVPPYSARVVDLTGTLSGEAVTRIENRADEIYDVGMKKLFANSQDRTMDFIVGADLYDHLERVMDRFEDVSNSISGILIEHL